jgi:hypothetical protein
MINNYKKIINECTIINNYERIINEYTMINNYEITIIIIIMKE